MSRACPQPTLLPHPSPDQTIVNTSQELICSHCGERIGVYEPFALEEDGAVRSSSYFDLIREEHLTSPRLLHWDCLAEIDESRLT